MASSWLLSGTAPILLKGPPPLDTLPRCSALVGLVMRQFRSRTSLIAENELLRQQLTAAKSRLQRKRVMFTGSRRLTIALQTRWTASWRTTVTLVQPATLLRGTGRASAFFRNGGHDLAAEGRHPLRRSSARWQRETQDGARSGFEVNCSSLESGSRNAPCNGT